MLRSTLKHVTKQNVLNVKKYVFSYYNNNILFLYILVNHVVNLQQHVCPDVKWLF